MKEEKKVNKIKLNYKKGRRQKLLIFVSKQERSYGLEGKAKKKCMDSSKDFYDFLL